MGSSPPGRLYRPNLTAIEDLTKELFALCDTGLLETDLTDIAMFAVKTRDKHDVLGDQNGKWGMDDQVLEIVRTEAAVLFVSLVAACPLKNWLPRTSTPPGKSWCEAVAELRSHAPDEMTTARPGISRPRRILDANPAADAVALLGYVIIYVRQNLTDLRVREHTA